jgi:hypothetical protein
MEERENQALIWWTPGVCGTIDSMSEWNAGIAPRYSKKFSVKNGAIALVK